MALCIHVYRGVGSYVVGPDLLIVDVHLSRLVYRMQLRMPG